MSDRIPRLSLSDLSGPLATFLTPRVQRLGYLGEFFQCMAHQPDALLSFLHFTEDLKHALPEDLTEVVILTVATLMDNAYERVQHERLCLKLGFSESWLQTVLALDTDSPVLTLEQHAVQRLTIAMSRNGARDSAPELDEVTQALGAPTSVATLWLIGRYMAHAMIVNALQLAPPALAVEARAQGY